MKWFDVYYYEDPHMGWGYLKSRFLVKAKSKEAAERFVNNMLKGNWKYGTGIREITQDVAYRLTHPDIPRVYNT